MHMGKFAMMMMMMMMVVMLARMWIAKMSLLVAPSRTMRLMRVSLAQTKRRSTLAAEMQQELKRQVMRNWRVSFAEGIGWSGLPEGVLERDLLVGVSSQRSDVADSLDALEGNVVEESGGDVTHISIGDEGTADGNGQSASEGSERGKARGGGSVQMDLSHWLH